MKRYCFALDLVDNKELIEEYKEHHRNFWPELREHTRRSGIRKLEIYLLVNRLFMIWETEKDFDNLFGPDDPDDALNKLSNEWEELMWKYQQAIPGCSQDEKWARMERIFEL